MNASWLQVITFLLISTAWNVIGFYICIVWLNLNPIWMAAFVWNALSAPLYYCLLQNKEIE